jgi:hypothetical protein
MKYLDKSFTIYPAVKLTSAYEDVKGTAEYDARRAKAKRPHEYENGGGICQLCGMDSKAKIHKVKA